MVLGGFRSFHVLVTTQVDVLVHQASFCCRTDIIEKEDSLFHGTIE